MPFGPEPVVRGTRDILAPTVMAGLAAALVLAPIVVVGSVPGFEILHPMTVVVLGGLLDDDAGHLFVVPVLYLRFGSVPDHDDWTDELFAPAPEPRPAPVEERAGVLRFTRLARAALPVMATLLLASCAGAVADEYTIEHEPAHVEKVAGSDHVKITLEERAAQRLAIRTTEVRKAARQLVVPSAAVIVDTEGRHWYANPEPLVFVRHEIAVDREGRSCLSLERSAGGHQGGDGGGAPAGRDRGRGRALSD